ncbi:hypothetical protein THAOC_25126, partial [Thalassiosira oceanica]
DKKLHWLLSESPRDPFEQHQPSKKVLEKAAKRKKDKYLEACRERQRDFIPMAYSVDGLAGKEARAAAEKRLASLLASKLDRPYSNQPPPQCATIPQLSCCLPCYLGSGYETITTLSPCIQEMMLLLSPSRTLEEPL